MECLKKGTIEPLLVAMRDRLNNITDLNAVSNPLFDVRRKTDDAAVQLNTPWVVDSDYPMTAICLIDTTMAGYIAGDEYKLYIRYTTGSEAPIRGPIEFRVEDD